MNKKTELVFAGWLGLNPDELEELNNAINNYMGQSQNRQIEIARDLNQSIRLGPLEQACPCCGK